MSEQRLNPIPGPAEPSSPGEVSPRSAKPQKERDIFGREPVGYPDWSHRRGEPRVFALIWMLFLMGVTILMFSAFMNALSISPSITRPAARSMIVATTIGIVAFWPALRLSQQPSDRPIRAVFRDMFVILVPAQAVIWPHALSALASWPLILLLAIAASMGAWALVIGGVIAIGDSTRQRVSGSWWMLAILAIAGFFPLYATLTGTLGMVRPDVPRLGWMFSPLTSMLELTRSRDEMGHPTPVYPGHWRLIGATACFGLALLILARACDVASRRRNP